MRLLGLDLGTKTLGIAITDKTNVIASPLVTLEFKHEDYSSTIAPLKEMINNYEITEIALGLPLNMDGSSGFAAQRSIAYKDMLSKYISIPITLIDERLTSIEAHNILSDNGKKTKEHKKNVDAVAATLILDSYLKRKVSNNNE